MRRSGGSTWGAGTWPLVVHALELRGRLAELEAQYLRRHRASEPVLERVRALLGPRTALVGWLEVDVGGFPTEASTPRRSWGYLYIVRQRGPVIWLPLWDGRLPPEHDASADDWGLVFARVRRAAEWPLRVEVDPVMADQLREWTHHFFDPAFPHLSG